MLHYPKDRRSYLYADTGGKLEAPGHWAREIARIVRRRALLIASCTAVCLLLAVAYAAVATRIFTATTSILVTMNQPAVLSLEAFNPLMGSEAVVESQVQILRSPALTEKVVRKLQLDKNPQFNGAKPRLLHRLMNAPLNVVASVFGDTLFPESVVSWRQQLGKVSEEAALANAVGNVLAAVNVSRVNLTYLINLSVSLPDPDMAAYIANGYANAYLVDQLDVRYDQTSRAASWLSSRLEEMKASVEKAEREVESYRGENNLLLTGGRFLNEQQLSELDTQLTLSKARVAETRARLEQAEAIARDGGDPSAIPEALSSEVINRLKTQYGEVARNAAELQNRFGPNHPTVLNIQAQVKEVRSLIDGEIRRIIQTQRNDHEIAKARELALRQTSNDLEVRSNEANQAKVRLRELEREAATSRTLYEAFLQRYKEMSARETLPQSDARVLAPASVPTAPTAPRSGLIIMAATMFGLFLGLAISFGIEHVDPGLKNRQQVEEVLGLPMMAQLPRVNDMRKFKSSSYAVENPLSGYAEGIRGLHMWLSIADGDRDVIAVASSLPEEGKTSTAHNLADYYASLGLKTLLIDADIRRPALTKTVAPGARRGLVEVLLGEIAYRDALIVSGKTGLSILPCVPSEKSLRSLELLSSHAMASLVDDARREFDVVIIDVSPVIPVIDAKAVFKLVDRIVMVVQWNVTSRHAIEEAIEQMRPWRDRIAGIVLNKTDVRKAQHYDHYDSRSYSKRYPHYYGTTN